MFSDTIKSLGKKASTDFALTMLATVALVGTLQLLVYPYLAWRFDSEQYGVILVAMGIVNILEPSLGSTLCNTRIVNSKHYERLNIEPSDFSLLIRVVVLLALLVSVAICLAAFTLDLCQSILVGVLCGLAVAKAYCLVAFRLHFDSKSLLKLNLLTASGCVFGIVVTFALEYWQIIFILGEFIALLYIWRKTNLLRECAGKTKLFHRTIRMYLSLISSNLINYASVYADRILLSPVLGNASVSIYYVSTFVGKASSFFSSPVGSITLSYLNDGVVKLSVKRYTIANIMILGIGGLIYAFSLVFGPLIASVLYPTLFEQALPYMALGNAASIIGVLNSFNLVIVLAIASSKFQVVASTLKLALYIVAIVIAAVLNNLFALCVAMLFANVIAFLFTYVVGVFNLRRFDSQRFSLN